MEQRQRAGYDAVRTSKMLMMVVDEREGEGGVTNDDEEPERPEEPANTLTRREGGLVGWRYGWPSLTGSTYRGRRMGKE